MKRTKKKIKVIDVVEPSDIKLTDERIALLDTAPLMLAVLKHTLARLEAKGIEGAWVDEIRDTINKAEDF